jgi:hypothetical protein
MSIFGFDIAIIINQFIISVYCFICYLSLICFVGCRAIQVQWVAGGWNNGRIGQTNSRFQARGQARDIHQRCKIHHVHYHNCLVCVIK